MGARFGLSVSPAKTTDTGHAITALNTGKVPITLTVSLAEVRKVSGSCKLTATRPAWAKVTPATLTLSPGERQSAHLALTGMPAHPTDVAVVFTTAPAASGAVRLDASVAAQVGVGHGTPACLSLPPVHSGGADGIIWLSVALAVAAVGATVARIIRRHPSGRSASAHAATAARHRRRR